MDAPISVLNSRKVLLKRQMRQVLFDKPPNQIRFKFISSPFHRVPVRLFGHLPLESDEFQSEYGNINYKTNLLYIML